MNPPHNSIKRKQQLNMHEFLSIVSISREVRLLHELLTRLNSLYEHAHWLPSNDNDFVMRVGLRELANDFSAVNAEKLPPSIREKFETLNKYIQRHMFVEDTPTNISQSQDQDITWRDLPVRDLQERAEDWLSTEANIKDKTSRQKRKSQISLKYELVAAVSLFFITTSFLTWRIILNIMTLGNGSSHIIYLYVSILVILFVVVFVINDLRQAIREL